MEDMEAPMMEMAAPDAMEMMATNDDDYKPAPESDAEVIRRERKSKVGRELFPWMMVP